MPDGPRKAGQTRGGLLLVLVLLAASLAGGAAAEPGPGDGEAVVAALEALEAALESERPTYTQRQLGEIAQELGASPEATRLHLLAGLDSLRAASEGASEHWRELVESGRGQLDPKRVNRFLRELLALARRAVAGDDNYVVQTSVRYAARQAGLEAPEATACLARILGRATGSRQRRSMVGVVVSGKTAPYERDMERAFLYFGTRDEAFVTEALREVHRFVVPRVVTRLPRHPKVKWAVRERDLTPLLDPDWRVQVTVQQLRFVEEAGQLRACMDLELAVALEDGMAPGRTIPLALCESGRDASEEASLTRLYEEVADAAAEAVGELLDQGWGGN